MNKLLLVLFILFLALPVFAARTSYTGQSLLGRLDEGSGSFSYAQDGSTFGIVNMAWVTGKFGNAIARTDVSTTRTLQKTDFHTTDDMTFGFWLYLFKDMNIRATPSVYADSSYMADIFQKMRRDGGITPYPSFYFNINQYVNGYGGNLGYHIWRGNTAKDAYIIPTYGASGDKQYFTRMKDNWTYITCSHKRLGYVRVYVNGKMVAETYDNRDIAVNDTGVAALDLLGRGESGYVGYMGCQGIIDDIFVEPRQLSHTEIKNIYLKGIGRHTNND